MFTIVLLISFAMMAYGIVRAVYADVRHKPGARVHILWIPGGAFLFAIGIAALTWL
ncbi:hypothetical protein JI721_09010 [Alicyclobacillus cycloheptanicus]|jgi:hypothetical protein|uniref:Uncharacterized protein n=1 Tax=Alicyclobacillus cycloheptanicus TaxID=1457 RepID=A0ABT9XH22_9BACL|nr:hypothetical protein [Alicyclobacillus cycloheptanicus]MDQ0189611.1 hypothetical protein [Alicyclobacillus cycloheptanicus]WDL99920.1 hypothetical protein JI721_09010 [Alicyclobacillus cycloheptanicus]